MDGSATLTTVTSITIMNCTSASTASALHLRGSGPSTKSGSSREMRSDSITAIAGVPPSDPSGEQPHRLLPYRDVELDGAISTPPSTFPRARHGCGAAGSSFPDQGALIDR